MGYVSDVRVVTSKNGYKKLEKYVKDYLKKHDRGDDWNLLNEVVIKKESPYTVYFGWNSLKWYEDADYVDVDAIMNGLNYLKEHGYSYRFSRFGESYDDYDEQYFESNKDEEQDLVYPGLIREFDDDYACEQIDYEIKLKNNDMEI